jgi:hypothetical protein
MLRKKKLLHFLLKKLKFLIFSGLEKNPIRWHRNDVAKIIIYTIRPQFQFNFQTQFQFNCDPVPVQVRLGGIGTNGSNQPNWITPQQLYIYTTSGYPCPKDTVKSPVSLTLVHVLVFLETFIFFIFYFYVFFVFFIISYNKNKVFLK